MCPRGSIVFVYVDVLFVATATPYIGCFAIIAIIKIQISSIIFANHKLLFSPHMQKEEPRRPMIKQKIQISSNFEIFYVTQVPRELLVVLH